MALSVITSEKAFISPFLEGGLGALAVGFGASAFLKVEQAEKVNVDTMSKVANRHIVDLP